MYGMTAGGGGYVSAEDTYGGGDCDDANAIINPATVWYKDVDNDGYSDGMAKIQCTQPTGYKLATQLTATSGDCDDSNAALNPATVWYVDADNDFYYNGSGLTQCLSPGSGYKMSGLTGGGDCDDANANINPATVWYKDTDNDGYSNGTTQIQCVQPTGYKLATQLIAVSGDCNDNNIAVNPAATEVCANNIDDNCNGQVDEGCSLTPTISINDVTVYESQGIAMLTVSLSKTSTQPIKINYQTVDGTAIGRAKGKNPVNDYNDAKGSVTIPAGTLTATISITIYSDGIIETPEYFDVQLSISKLVSATISKANGRVTILDGAQPLLTKNSVSSKSVQPDINIALQLNVVATPNPASQYFTISTESNSRELLTIRVSDELGRITEIRNNVLPNSHWQIGNNYHEGFYIMEIMQGNMRKIIKLLKL